MSKVVALMSMSLDGYVADRDDDVADVFAWYFNSGDVEFHTGGADPMTFTVSAPSAEHLRSLVVHMRPLRYSINVAMDGCCDHPAMIADEALHRHAAENIASADALLSGRVTYEMMEAA